MKKFEIFSLPSACILRGLRVASLTILSKYKQKVGQKSRIFPFIVSFIIFFIGQHEYEIREIHRPLNLLTYFSILPHADTVNWSIKSVGKCRYTLLLLDAACDP